MVSTGEERMATCRAPRKEGKGGKPLATFGSVFGRRKNKRSKSERNGGLISAEQRAVLLGIDAHKKERGSRDGNHHDDSGDMDATTLFVNQGQDDEMEVCAFRPSMPRTVLTYLGILVTCGLLRLFFHWVPHLYLKARCVPCPVTDRRAQFVLITELFNETHKIHHVKRLKVLTSAQVTARFERDDSTKDGGGGGGGGGDEKAPGNEAEKVDAAVAMDNGDECCVQQQQHELSVHFGDGHFRPIDKLLIFTCKKVTYLWDANKATFVKLRGLDQAVSSDTLHRSRGLSKQEQYTRRAVYGPNEIVVKESSIPTLLFLEVLNPFYIFQLFSFILWFADDYYYYAATIMLMSAFGITSTVIQTRKNQRNLKSTVQGSDVARVLRAHPDDNSGDELKSLNAAQTETISTEFLVPGDVLEIPPHGCVMQCDALLLVGNCILNESMLTGESVPVTKTPFPHLADLRYDAKEHARHTLFCGTHVIQTRYFGNEKVLAVVIRTGFSTAKGELVRSILYPPPVDFRFERDSYKFVMMLGLVSCMGFVYTLVTKYMRGVAWTDMFVEALDLITIVVPPALPAAMTVGRLYAQTRLQKDQIFCISPRSINVSGSIDCVCFDKTGTLTEDGLDLLCVVPIKGRIFENPTGHVDRLPYDAFLYGLVCCHSLTIIDKQISGDPLDLKMFESTRWAIEDPEVSDNNKFNMIFPTVFRPPRDRPRSSANALENAGGDGDNNDDDDDSDAQMDLQIGVIREFPFSSSAQRMGVIIRRLGARHFEFYAKGSPEMILNYVRADSVPADFRDVLEHYTSEGYRVIALAHKTLNKMTYAKAQKVQREAIECEMTLLGLIVLENRLKEDTAPCIEALNDARIRVIMVTGDNILTAVSVARDCDIITPGQAVITVNVDAAAAAAPSTVYYSLTSTKDVLTRPNNTTATTFSNSSSVNSLETLESQVCTTPETATSPPAPNCVAADGIVGGADVEKCAIRNNDGDGNKGPNERCQNDYRFAMTGKTWSVIRDEHPHLIPKLVTRGSIFARMAPDQKQQLVQELQALGYYVAMCGDGANDCGALKAAHTGISLSEAESSVASPFTSKNANITCVLNVIKEGRAALVTSFGIFKYMAAYSLCQFASVMILYGFESNLTDIEFLYIDLFIISVFAFFFGRTAAYKGKLVKETPLNSLISLSPILSLFLQMALVLAFQVGAYQHVQLQDWYHAFNASSKLDKDEVGCVENYTIFTVSSFQYIILAIVFSKGPPYRESIFSNRGLLVSAVAVATFSIYMALCPSDFLVAQFELVLPDDITFRLYLLVYALANFVLAIVVEVVLVEQWLFKRLRYKFHDVTRSKRKYLAIERDLDKDGAWPALCSDYKSGAGARKAPEAPTVHAEIVYESERFDKNHVLNSFLYGSNGTKSEMGGIERYKSLEDGDFQSALALASSPSVGGASPVVGASSPSVGGASSDEASFATAGSDLCATTPCTPLFNGAACEGAACVDKRCREGHRAGRVRTLSQSESGAGKVTVLEMEMDVLPQQAEQLFG